MKKEITLAIMIMLLWIAGASAQSCLPGYLYWTTQAEIDSFSINHPNCTEIEGNLMIKGSDISNLDGLSALSSIGGYLRISENPMLTDLSGLENLLSVGEEIRLYDNPLLNSVSVLSNLNTTGNDLAIYHNTSLTSLAGLENLTAIPGGVGISDCALTNLLGLNNMTDVGGNLSLSDLPGITSLNGLGQLTSVGETISIRNNENLTSLSGIGPVSTAGGLRLFNNDALTEITDLNSITAIGEGGLNISNNNSLVSLSGLENVISIAGMVSFDGNMLLTDLSGLDGLTTIGQNLHLRDYSYGGNASLTSLHGLENLTEIGGITEFQGNTALTSLDGLENLERIKHSLWIINNPVLENIHALSKLTSVGSEIVIDSNLMLSSLSGLDNVSIDSICCLYIYDNPILLECEVQSVCDFLAGTPEYVYIINNAIGCNNQVEVEQACESAGISDSEALSISVYPNPATEIISIRYPTLRQAQDKLPDTRYSLFIYDMFGRRMTEIRASDGQEEIRIDVSDYPGGIYVVRGKLDMHVFSSKFNKL
jgi:hypothetical protein